MMTKKIRKLVRIDAETDRFLKQRASKLGVTQSEVVRKALARAADRAASDRQRQASEDEGGQTTPRRNTSAVDEE